MTAPAVLQPRSKVAPGWMVWTLIVLATIVAMAATVNTWVDRQLLDTDEWVDLSDDLLANDAVRGALSSFLVAELFRTVDVQGELESLLPGPTAGLAGPIAATLQGNAVGFVDQLLASDAVGRLWTEMNTVAHTTFVRVVTDDMRLPVSTANGDFVVDARPLLVAVIERLGLPSGVSDRLPPDAGQFVVFESDQLDAVQRAVQLIEVLSVYLFMLVVVLYGAAVFLAVNRRLALRNVGCGLVAGSVILLIIHRLMIRVSVEQLASAQSGREAVDAIMSIITNLFDDLAWAGLSVGAIVVAYAVLIGPSAVAVAARRMSAPVMTNPVGAWLAALSLLLLYVVLVPGFKVERWVPLVVFAGLFIAAVESLRRQIAGEYGGDIESATV